MEVTKLTVPDTLAPFAGDLIVTEPAGAGVEVGVAVFVAVAVEVAVKVGVLVRVGVGRRLAAIAVPPPATAINKVTATMRKQLILFMHSFSSV